MQSGHHPTGVAPRERSIGEVGQLGVKRSGDAHPTGAAPRERSIGEVGQLGVKRSGGAFGLIYASHSALFYLEARQAFQARTKTASR